VTIGGVIVCVPIQQVTIGGVIVCVPIQQVTIGGEIVYVLIPQVFICGEIVYVPIPQVFIGGEIVYVSIPQVTIVGEIVYVPIRSHKRSTAPKREGHALFNPCHAHRLIPSSTSTRITNSVWTLRFGKKGEKPYNVTAKNVALTFIICRTRDLNEPLANGQPRPKSQAAVNHIAYTIADYDRAKVLAELKRMGFDNPREDGEHSFHIAIRSLRREDQRHQHDGANQRVKWTREAREARHENQMRIAVGGFVAGMTPLRQFHCYARICSMTRDNLMRQP
jgi:hypothetical protein